MSGPKAFHAPHRRLFAHTPLKANRRDRQGEGTYLFGSVISRNRTAFHGNRYRASPLERWMKVLNSQPRIHEPSVQSWYIALSGCENSGVLSTIMQYACGQSAFSAHGEDPRTRRR